MFLRKRKNKSIFIIYHSRNQRNVTMRFPSWKSVRIRYYVKKISVCFLEQKQQMIASPPKEQEIFTRDFCNPHYVLDTVLCQSSDLLFTDRDRLLKEVEK